MVNYASATACTPAEEVDNRIAISADHSKIVKFTSRTDHNYLQVRMKLGEVIGKTEKNLLERVKQAARDKAEHEKQESERKKEENRQRGKLWPSDILSSQSIARHQLIHIAGV